ncbi:ATP-binding response regulator [Asticcacaulis solisilvae]|uniref:ATP-binding response regulator n=1 Tax=Asticcacaulis solisilvae TaxID=1217274 RepID=UPI003FD8269E
MPIVAISLIAMAWSYADHGHIIAWTLVTLATQLGRAGLYIAYRRRKPQGPELKRWAFGYTVYMFITGIVWGATAFIFLVPNVPITVALTFCGMYSLGAGSIAVNAYHLPSYYAFVASMFVTALIMTLRMGDMGFVILGLGSIGFAVMTILFARLQSRIMRESIAIRFENIKILAEMKEARDEAEAARRQAEAANLSKSQFLAAASHDLRQPLHALSLFSGALGNFRLGEEETAVVRHIQSNIAAMEGLFNGLLDLSRLEAGAVRKVVRPFAVRPMFDRLDRFFTPLASEKGLSLRLVPTGLWALGDEILAEQILMNLIANALRYTREGGVVIGARRQDGRIVFQVSDSGEGIAEPDRKRIFEEFVQIGNQERDRRKGLGLGLAISARTAALLDTRIDLRSAPGKGSRFGFGLPRAEAALPEMTGGSRPAGPLGGLRLLVVDDDQAVREALALLLKGWGVDFTIADGIDAAKAALAGSAFDVVISDYRLREGPVGLDFLTGLDGVKGRALVTGDVDPDLLRSVEAAGVMLVHKPVDPARLRAMLNHLASVKT